MRRTRAEGLHASTWRYRRAVHVKRMALQPSKRSIAPELGLDTWQVTSQAAAVLKMSCFFASCMKPLSTTAETWRQTQGTADMRRTIVSLQACELNDGLPGISAISKRACDAWAISNGPGLAADMADDLLSSLTGSFHLGPGQPGHKFMHRMQHVLRHSQSCQLSSRVCG